MFESLTSVFLGTDGTEIYSRPFLPCHEGALTLFCLLGEEGEREHHRPDFTSVGAMDSSGVGIETKA